MLEIRNLRAGYGAINVLWDVNLSFAEGQLTTIVGPNGPGKSTLLKTIMGLGPTSQGEAAMPGTRAIQTCVMTLLTLTSLRR